MPEEAVVQPLAFPFEADNKKRSGQDEDCLSILLEAELEEIEFLDEGENPEHTILIRRANLLARKAAIELEYTTVTASLDTESALQGKSKLVALDKELLKYPSRRMMMEHLQELQAGP